MNRDVEEDVLPCILMPYVYAYLLENNFLMAAESLLKEASASGALVVRHASLCVICSAIL